MDDYSADRKYSSALSLLELITHNDAWGRWAKSSMWLEGVILHNRWHLFMVFHLSCSFESLNPVYSLHFTLVKTLIIILPIICRLPDLCFLVSALGAGSYWQAAIFPSHQIKQWTYWLWHRGFGTDARSFQVLHGCIMHEHYILLKIFWLLD